MSITDAEALRRRALARLGPLGDDLAREVLEESSLRIEPSVATWESSHGTVHAHRVVLGSPAELRGRLAGSPATEDALASAIAGAIAEDPLASLYDLRFEHGSRAPRRRPPYR